MILLKPLITEKSMSAVKNNQYSFEVNLKASKHQIKEAVQNQFDVSVVKINTSLVKPLIHRSFRTGKDITHKAVKKAFVALKKGQTIKLFDVKNK